MQGLIGKKVGMTRVFMEDTGRAIAATIVSTGANVVHQVKTVERDGYSAVQLGFDPVPADRVAKPRAGHFAKHGSEPTRVIREVKLDSADEEIQAGAKFGAEMLENVKFVDVTGVSKGRGFAGTIKRHNFQRGRETHGNTNHRERGSLGAGTYPARVFPGVKMAGRYGGKSVTKKGIEILGIDTENNLIYLKGAVPGARKGIVFLSKNNSKKK